MKSILPLLYSFEITTTEVITDYVTECPEKHSSTTTVTAAAPVTTQGGVGIVESAPALITSTIYIPRTETVTACPLSAIICLAIQQTIYVTTKTIIAHTTTYPLPSTSTTTTAQSLQDFVSPQKSDSAQRATSQVALQGSTSTGARHSTTLSQDGSFTSQLPTRTSASGNWKPSLTESVVAIFFNGSSFDTVSCTTLLAFIMACAVSLWWPAST